MPPLPPLTSPSPEAWTGPVLRWAGSKRKLLPVLMANAPCHYRRYIEPFAGSACLFFALKPDQAVLGDINAELLTTYRTLQAHPRRVSHGLRTLPRTKRAYYRLRALNPAVLSDVDRAARFIYLNRYCFNGVYRINRHGMFNVPRGVRTGALPSDRDIYRCAIALRRAKLRHGDFANSLRDAGSGDFVYLDPPYTSTSRTTYGEYGYDCFSNDDLPRLVGRLVEIDQAGAQFLLSYAPTRALLGLLPPHWKVRNITVRRHIAGFARSRKIVREFLISNVSLPSLDVAHER